MLNNPQGQDEGTADASFADALNEFEITSRVAGPGATARAVKGKGKGKRPLLSKCYRIERKKKEENP